MQRTANQAQNFQKTDVVGHNHRNWLLFASEQIIGRLYAQVGAVILVDVSMTEVGPERKYSDQLSGTNVCIPEARLPPAIR